MNKKNKIQNSFFAATSILTLVVMLIGSTFAYFSSVFRSDEQINVTSVDIRLGLSIKPLYNGVPLIPTNDDDIDIAYQNKCKDSLGNGACTAYTVKITNTGDPQFIASTFKIDNENFLNMKYILIDPLDNSRYQDVTSVSTKETKLGKDLELDSGESKEFILVMWISNLVDKQDYEQGQEFSGTVSVNAASGAKLTGIINENIG